METSERQQQLAKCLQQCARGEHAGLKRLYNLTSANLFSVALRILNDRQLAEDCLQQVFLNIWHHAERYDSSKAQALTWLNTITRNQALDLLRRNKHSRLHDGDEALNEQADESPDQEQQVTLWQQSKQLHQCLEQIPENQRRCLEMAYFEGLTHQSLSERIDTSLGTVKTWIRRGLARLQTCMNSI
ncbi:RNA polymerase subunit sigma-70 [Motiliproteus coralliicola]|uniref:RNA polymerase subunit sigma-70 n=1 Tax=Motiliproteus coralliicola TaxID=2283196 RepID=A0A369WXE1_9GAMM|nr:sigma-70 family RNA polymerase sigma factor [Motiliproteus coralliicola]RDE24175.1 RNA polymerase subunit sigma-70 [Motiliproteus coralliicola]